jgi:hypothetical protein
LEYQVIKVKKVLLEKLVTKAIKVQEEIKEIKVKPDHLAIKENVVIKVKKVLLE